MPTTVLKRNPVLFADDVEQTRDLGKGFMVIKLRSQSGMNTAQKNSRHSPLSVLSAEVPDISLDRIQALLEQQTAWPTADKPANSNARNTAIGSKQAFTIKLDKQSLEFRQQQLDKGVLLTSADFLAPLGISRQALSKAVKEQRMFYVDGPSSTQLYPAFFVTDKRQRRLLEKVSKTLGDLPGPSKWQFFLTPKSSLGGRSPVAALHDGDFERVMAAAAAFKGR